MQTVSSFNMDIDRLRVFKVMDCTESSPVYDEVNKDYYDLKELLYKLAEPKGIFCFLGGDEASDFRMVNGGCEKVVLAIVTLGKPLDSQIGQFFTDGDYLKGMLLDVMADELLFNLSIQLDDKIYEEAYKLQMGLTQRLSPGEGGIPLLFQKKVFDLLDAQSLLKMSISEGYMLDPIKSAAFFHGADKDLSLHKITHDCAQCNLLNCKFRRLNDQSKL